MQQNDLDRDQAHLAILSQRRVGAALRWIKVRQGHTRQTSAMTIAELFAANVPRYTSYPTAPHFHKGVDEKISRSWLQRLPSEEPLSLYAHIPFCDSLCWFCACHTRAANHYAPVQAYCDLLLQEIDLVADALPGRMKVRHIHWGGGSPTILDSTDIARLSSHLRARFDITSDAEFAVEIDPRGFSPAMAQDFARAGVTRASMGVQDCDPAVQRAINRIQSDDQTFDAVAHLRAEGIRSINLDLVYGLPRQTLESWGRTLDFILWLKPDRIAVFGYAHVPSFKKQQALIPAELLPDVETRLRMAELARQILCAHGYVAVGIDHYALPGDALAKAAIGGRLFRNFQGYTTDSASSLIGLGASSISALPQGYVQNESTVPAWRTAITAGHLPVGRGVVLTDQDRLRRTIIERLMCDLEVDLESLLQDAAGRQDMEDAFLALTELADRGIVKVDAARIIIPAQWRTAARLVASSFDAYLERRATGHSVAV